MRTLEATLSSKSLQKLIDELEAYRKSLDHKADVLRQRVAEMIRWSAEAGFSTALTTDIFTGAEPPPADVQVNVEDDGDVTLVIASGEEAVFIEFGAGVYYNGAAGTSPHPAGEANGFLIGEYGKGQGKKNVWALPGSSHDYPILTHGTPAAMPMYHGLQEVLTILEDLAKEVFNE